MNVGPGINDEDIGIRSYQLRKEQAVERALEKIRQNLAGDWSELKDKEIEILQWALGECWALVSRREWENFVFSATDLPTVLKIIEIGRQIITHQKMGYLGFQEIHQILSDLS